MREWFIVGSKLLGLYFLYSVITSMLSSSGLFLFLLMSSNSFFPKESSTEVLLITAFTIVAEIGFAFPLLFKAEWIADKLKLPTANHSYSAAFGNEKLQPGIILIGIYIFTINIGGLAKVFALSRKTVRLTSPFGATQPEGLTFSRDFIEPCVTILISLCLIFGSKYIAAFLTRNKSTATEQQNRGDRE
jgi:hypothetical protein